eukprot:7037678-Prymnesium_polylepis.1
MASTWQSHQSRDNRMVITWQLHDTHMAITWQSYQSRGNRMTIAWQSHANHMAITWQSHGNHMAAGRAPRVPERERVKRAAAGRQQGGSEKALLAVCGLEEEGGSAPAWR